MIGRRELTCDDVRKLVFTAVSLIVEVQQKLDLPICPHLDDTRERLLVGEFRAEAIPKNGNSSCAFEYGAFDPPSTIILDSNLPFCDSPHNIPQLPNTLSTYCATHEVIHADDYTGFNVLLLATFRHIINDHVDKLESGMQLIEEEGGRSCIGDIEELAELWAMQYVDMVTHYRSYVVLRNKQFPKLDLIWIKLRNHLFPPNLLSCIERKKGIDYVFDILTRRAGDYCLVDALKEFENIDAKNAAVYTV
jgi:hypothetical protein